MLMVGVLLRYLVTAIPSSEASINLVTAASSKIMLAMAACKNFVTVISLEDKYLVTAVSLASAKNLVTVVSRNFVTLISFVSRKRVEAVPRNLLTARSF